MDNTEKVFSGFISEPEVVKMRIEWKDSFNVNVEQIDTQHKRLLNIINDLKDCVDLKINPVILDRLTDLSLDLSDYTIYHFTCEEKLMTEHSYPEIDEQKKEHQYFIAKVNDFKEKIQSDKRLNRDILTFLTNWFLDHVQKKDRKLGKFLNHKIIR